VAAQLMQDPRARRRMERFHAMWLGYLELPHAVELNQALGTETTALISKVIFEDRADYLELLTSDETYLNDALAQHYGLSSPGPSGFAWVSYGQSGRRGILSHGSLLSQGAKFGDTSPTIRGLWIRNRLFCQDVPPPPPTVDADEPPAVANGSPCKVDRYAVHAQGGCANCHRLMDPVGFGLENYDPAGKYRTVEPNQPTCTIAGQGALDGVGTFSGPGELSTLLASTGAFEGCAVRQLVRFAVGRRESAEDEGLIAELATGFRTGQRRFDQLLLDVVSHPTFAFRREE
jgi:hypothetical protein